VVCFSEMACGAVHDKFGITSKKIQVVFVFTLKKSTQQVVFDQLAKRT